MTDLRPDGAPALLAASLLLFVLAMAHSYLRRGAARTRYIFGIASLFFVIKGLVDLPRPPETMPYHMNLALFERGGHDLGVYLLLLPVLRVALAYAALSGAEAVLARSERRRDRLWALNGLSMFFFCLSGVGVEVINVWTDWWTWGAEAQGAFLVGFIMWMLMAVAVFPAVLIGVLDVARPERLWKASVGCVIGYYVFLIGISAAAPMLRNVVLLPGAALVMLLGFRTGGARLKPLRLVPS